MAEVKRIKGSGKFLRVANRLTLLGCFFLFTYLSFGIFEQYARHTTIEDLHREHVESFDMPTLVICLQDPFKPNNFILTRHDYLNQTYSVSMKRPVICHYSDVEYCAYLTRHQFKTSEILTKQSGRCKVLTDLPKVIMIPCFVMVAL